jgi:hypothetical protein
MRVFRRLAWALLVLACYTGSATSVRADGATFATFGETDSNNSLVFTNNSGLTPTATLGSAHAAGIPVSFSFLQSFVIGSVPPSLQNVPAHMVFVPSPLIGDPSGATFSGGIGSQQLTGSVEFVRDSDNLNLLTVSFTNGLFYGKLGGNKGTVGADDNMGNNVIFTSAAPGVVFSPGADNALSWSVNSVMPILKGPQGDGMLRSWNGFVNGMFTSTPTTPVPEPGTLALAFTALPILGLVVLRRQKRS